jgi:threonyl-tRNA synthetase
MGEESAKAAAPAGEQQNLPDRSASNAPPTGNARPPQPAAGKAKQQKRQAPVDAPLPDFIIERNKLFEELKKQAEEDLKHKPHTDITVTIDIGNGAPSTVIAKAWQSTPGSFLKDIPKELSSNVVIAKLDGKELWDLDRPLERDCRVTYLPFDSAEGREVFWHSSAHALGEACECEYGCLLSHGPPTAQGFFYDMAMPEGYVLPTSRVAYTRDSFILTLPQPSCERNGLAGARFQNEQNLQGKATI